MNVDDCLALDQNLASSMCRVINVSRHQCGALSMCRVINVSHHETLAPGLAFLSLSTQRHLRRFEQTEKCFEKKQSKNRQCLRLNA